MVLQTKQGLVRISNIYRPPYSNKNKHTQKAFCEDFKTYMEELEEKPGTNIILGDFNVPFQRTDVASTKYLRELAQTHGYRLLISEITHNKGGTIDQILIKEEINSTVPEVLKSYTISDHFPIKIELNMTAKTATQESIITEIYDTRNFDENKFSTDLRTALQWETYDSV